MTLARAFCVVALLAVCAAPSIARGGDPERPLLLRLADEKDPAHGAARKEWDGLLPPARLAMLREGLRSADPALALVAARATDSDVLSNDEIRRQMKILLKQPEVGAMWGSSVYSWSEASPIPASLGAVDMVPLWTALASLPDLEPGKERPDLHRTMLPEHAEALLPLLETAGPVVFGGLLYDLATVANHIGDDAHRAALARAFLYGHARLRAERAGEPRPKWESVNAATAGPGLPPAFVALARVMWGLDDDPADADPSQVQGLYTGGPEYWLEGWARDLVPEAKDVPFLLELAGAPSPRSPETARAWAVRRLEPFFESADVRKLFEELAGERDAAATFAAAALAKKGKPERWLEILENPHGMARLLEWETDPTRARARWAEGFLAGGASDGPPNLEVMERAKAEQSWGIAIREDDLRWIADRILVPEAPPPGLLDFFLRVAPELVTPKAVSRIAKALHDRLDGEMRFPSSIEDACTLLEAHDGKALREVLTHLAETRRGESRDTALILLARLGDTAHVPAMLESWPRWRSDAPMLGRVHDPSVETFLKGQVGSDDDELARSALHALAIFGGLPEPRHNEIWPLLPNRQSSHITKEHAEDHSKEWADLLRMVLAGDPIGAAIEHPVAVEDLGFWKDPRATERLRRLRSDRLQGEWPVYWSATAGLAAAGDPDAKRDYEEFLRDGRTWMLDSQQSEAIAFTRVHPEWIDFWVDRLDSNCCTAFQAYAVLHAIYPTMPIDHVVADGGRMRGIAKKWLARHRGHFVWSRILDAWVPSN